MRNKISVTASHDYVALGVLGGSLGEQHLLICTLLAAAVTLGPLGRLPVVSGSNHLQPILDHVPAGMGCFAHDLNHHSLLRVAGKDWQRRVLALKDVVHAFNEFPRCDIGQSITVLRQRLGLEGQPRPDPASQDATIGIRRGVRGGGTSIEDQGRVAPLLAGSAQGGEPIDAHAVVSSLLGAVEGIALQVVHPAGDVGPKLGQIFLLVEVGADDVDGEKTGGRGTLLAGLDGGRSGAVLGTAEDDIVGVLGHVAAESFSTVGHIEIGGR